MFYRKEKDIRLVVHVDDFTVLGSRVGLDWFREVIQCRMEVKFKGKLGRRRPGAVRILNRIAMVVSGGLEYEVDQRQAKVLIEEIGVDEGSRGVSTPGSHGEGGQYVAGQQKREQVQSSSC